MGEVFLATREDGQRVVIKRIHPALARQQGFVDRFLAEAKALAAINHPHVVRVLAFGEDAGAWTLTMEFVDGVELRHHRAAADLAFAARLGLELADALHAVHRAGLVHGDVNPRNVLVESTGRAVLIDFGLAARGGEGHGEGTLAYSAPEQLLDHARTPATDQFALGVVLWELFSGRRAFERDSDVEIISAVTDERLPRLSIPRGLADVVERMTSPDPAERYADLREVRDALKAEAARLKLDVAPVRAPVVAPTVVARAAPVLALTPALTRALGLLRDGMTTEEAEAALDGAAIPGLPSGLDALEDLLAAGALRAEDDPHGHRRFFQTAG